MPLLAAAAAAQSPQTEPALLDAAPAAITAATGPQAGLTSRWLVRLADAPVPAAPFDVRHRGLSPAQSASLRTEENRDRELAYQQAWLAAAEVLGAAGATVVHHLPQLHSSIVDMTAEAAKILDAQPQIATIAADRLMRGQNSAALPSDDALLASEHHGARTAHALGHTGANQTSLLAILDYWLLDSYGGLYRAHETLHEGGSIAHPSRVLLQASPGVGTQWTGFLPKPYGVDHGVGMAAFAAGAATAQPTSQPLANGQAPGAGLVGVNITRYWNQSYSCGGQTYLNTGYFSTISDMATALNWLAANPTVGATPIRVACLAFGGPTNPDHALALAVDGLAVNNGILVVTPSGNYDPNANNPFEAFNTCNGVCVAGTDKAPGALGPHRPDPTSGQGPLTRGNTAVPCGAGFYTSPGGAVPLLLEPNWRMPNFPGVGDAYRREYPDIAAISGASFAAVARDESKKLDASGTSIATAIVAGAATLWLNGPDGGTPPTTSILETKAALLAAAGNTNPNGAGDNQRGAGFLRTDRLTNHPLTDAQTTTATTSITNRAGQRMLVASFLAKRPNRYSVAVTWFRTDLNPGLVNGQPNWADIDLVVVGSSTGVLADVASRVNPADTFGNRTWERFGFDAVQNETISVFAVVNREASGTAPITLGVATSALFPAAAGPAAALTSTPSLTAAPCTVLQTTPSAVYSSLPAGVAFDPVPYGSYRQFALGLMPENSGSTGGSNSMVRIELRGRFARSVSIPCSLVSAQHYSGPGVPAQCPLPPGPVTLGPSLVGGTWPSTLVVDAAAGTATAEFAAIHGGFGPRFLVFDATPDMAFLMPRVGPTTAPCGLVPWSRAYASGGAWSTTTAIAHRATYQLPSALCTQWGCGSFYYDLTVTRGTWTSPAGLPELTVTPGLPTLRATGVASPGRTYNLVVERAEQGPALNWSMAVVVADFAGNEVPLGPPGCMSIFKPTTSYVSSAYPFGPSQLEGSISIPVATALDPALLGQRFFQQAIVASDVGGALQTVPTAQVIDVRIGW
ncbi:MAG: S8 family serine peptidase [Planctomycetota bacterium]